VRSENRNAEFATSNVATLWFEIRGQLSRDVLLRSDSLNALKRLVTPERL